MSTPTTKNRQILLASRPNGEPSEENFKLVEVEIPKPDPGQMLVRTIYLSLDPTCGAEWTPALLTLPRSRLAR